ncbi:UNKNOWN [Stylonychia lemnae]|uniref:Uncharacterized protein n=1 Tax=Stylonychia lemnae TaxID=5949 RepID=A0A078B4D7_STYLE|nr:UNKNOWN [Stylonychia lemnae]|eukprot:CDW88368.1 UNKNOWN [Stylonychia lemnae]
MDSSSNDEKVFDKQKIKIKDGDAQGPTQNGQNSGGRRLNSQFLGHLIDNSQRRSSSNRLQSGHKISNSSNYDWSNSKRRNNPKDKLSSSRLNTYLDVPDQCSTKDKEESFEYHDKKTNVKLTHIKRSNVDQVGLEKHLSDLHYSDPFFDGMPPIIFTDSHNFQTNQSLFDGWKLFSNQILGYFAPKSPFYVWHNVVTNDDQTFYKSNVLKNSRSEKQTLPKAQMVDEINPDFKIKSKESQRFLRNRNRWYLSNFKMISNKKCMMEDNQDVNHAFAKDVVEQQDSKNKDSRSLIRRESQAMIENTLIDQMIIEKPKRRTLSPSFKKNIKRFQTMKQGKEDKTYCDLQDMHESQNETIGNQETSKTALTTIPKSNVKQRLVKKCREQQQI